MFALRFRFPAGRYHATPWGRNVNEADVAWPPEPWRLLRAIVAAYWRKGDQERWSADALGRLINILAEAPPVFRLPNGAVHTHTRHYMPQARGTPKLVFDAFLHMPEGATVTVSWPDVTLDADLFSLATDLATSIGYLGRAESWTDCQALAECHDAPNCGPANGRFHGDPVRLLAPLSPQGYTAERRRLIADERKRLSDAAKPRSAKRLETDVAKAFRNNATGVDTLPERLVDAISIDTADLQAKGWPRPPASQEILYARAKSAAPGVVPRSSRRGSRLHAPARLPTVGRYLLAGRPRPRVEDAVKIGELMRLAALSKFGWEKDESTGRRTPNAPPVISGRGDDGKPLRDPSHVHAYWLPEDADLDGLIDHISVFIADGIGPEVRAKLDRITRLWLEPRQRVDDGESDQTTMSQEWRLALEGFGSPDDFAGSGYIFGRSRCWRSATPFLAAGRLNRGGYAREFRRLVKRTGLDRRHGFDACRVEVSPLDEIEIGGARRRILQYHRFRSRGGEVQHDTAGSSLEVKFPCPVEGPLALGYGSHFGLGLFALAE